MSAPNSLLRSHSLGRVLAIAACGLAGAAAAQTPPAAAAAPAADEPVQRVEVTGERSGGEMRERRESTVAKTVIGREDIERYGDATLGEVLKRLPGVTLDGAPGRGGNPRLRGLGSGYTQVLLDGEPVPRGFEIDSLAPEQIERIEILRAPTAETGARAIAGTINIVTREGFRKRLNDVRLSLGLEDGRWSPGLNWSRNGSADALAYTFNLNAQQLRGSVHGVNTLERGPAGGAPTLRRKETSDGDFQRQRLTFNGRLQWRLGEGESFTLTPFAIYSESDSRRHAALSQLQGTEPVPYALADTEGRTRFAMARLSAQRNQRLADGTRLEWRASTSRWQYDDDALRQESGAADGPHTRDDHARLTDRGWSASVKASTLLADAHSGVAGVELEGLRREEARRNLLDGQPLLAQFGDSLQARSQRVAVYAQDEWEVSPRLGAHVGLRWESIETRGEGLDGAQRNRSAVWSPVLHAVWKLDPAKRDQLRMSLTRSYRALTLGSLIGRPVPTTQANSPTNPDRAGNPALRPELATGLDLALERYLGSGGVLSAGVFHREISDMVRNDTRLEGGRWVNRPYNVGDATVQGLELEAKFALREVLAQAPALELRSGVSFFRSRVHDVPGPDNRVDQQPGTTANLGADWKPRGWPLTLGGNLHWTPGYVTRLSATETARVGRKPVFDAYALWSVSPALALRLSAANFTAPDFVRGSAYDSAALNLRESSQTVSRTYVDWTLRLEMKL